LCFSSGIGSDANKCARKKKNVLYKRSFSFFSKKKFKRICPPVALNLLCTALFTWAILACLLFGLAAFDFAGSADPFFFPGKHTQKTQVLLLKRLFWGKSDHERH
jgi:peptidoglycan/LPS O-acetylase OafA/YrhL